jgi:hypothetical protein
MVLVGFLALLVTFNAARVVLLPIRVLVPTLVRFVGFVGDRPMDVLQILLPASSLFASGTIWFCACQGGAFLPCQPWGQMCREDATKLYRRATIPSTTVLFLG